ncbi:hypothetical protein [Saccharopolyspora spinosa]|uniref:Uncharacterized protein n=1 Tax=Saccharopolyspora spinosa TaxID=60894 RepID=A0A2N3Y8J8_SACSN|nr:hypothetical protein [Saccharopolyspora spinosa]PKW19249.1 hypothetical protein A8926_7412 [Saccharopolyspora spinosa]
MYRDPDTRKCARVPEGLDYYPTKHAAKLAGDVYERRLRSLYSGLGVEVAVERSVPTLASYGPDAIRRMPNIKARTMTTYLSAVRMGRGQDHQYH